MTLYFIFYKSLYFDRRIFAFLSKWAIFGRAVRCKLWPHSAELLQGSCRIFVELFSEKCCVQMFGMSSDFHQLGFQSFDRENPSPLCFFKQMRNFWPRCEMQTLAALCRTSAEILQDFCRASLRKMLR